MQNTSSQGNYWDEELKSTLRQSKQLLSLSQAAAASGKNESEGFDEAYHQLTKYEKSRHFNELNLESLVHKKFRNTMQAGFECSHFVQELVTSHAEEEQWQSRRKEFFQSNYARSIDAESNKLKHLQCRSPLMTLVENVMWNSTQAIKKLFAA